MGELMVSAGVLDVASLPSAVDVAVGDEPVWSLDEGAAYNPVVSHVVACKVIRS